MRSLVVTVALSAAIVLPLHAQRTGSAPYRDKQIPHEAGFRVFIVPDMEGMGSAVDSREILAGNEGAAYKDLVVTRLLGSLSLPAHPGSERHDQGCARRRRRKLRRE